MPGGDRTGPLGRGPMTGRAAGYCAGYPMPGYMNPIPGRGWFGFGRGLGRGRGLRRGFGPGFGRGRGWGAFHYPYIWDSAYPYADYPYGPELTAEQETQMLKAQAKAMQEDIASINERIKELKSSMKEEKS